MKKFLWQFLLFLIGIFNVTTSFGATNIAGLVFDKNGNSINAMVLANGQHTFSNSGDGKYNINVPLDSNGKITIFSFADGFAPFTQNLTPTEASNFSIVMQTALSTNSKMAVSYKFDTSTKSGWLKISGKTLSSDGTPLCAMILINGQRMFSSASTGEYSLEAPLDANNSIMLMVFADGFLPYKEILYPNSATAVNSSTKTLCAENDNINIGIKSQDIKSFYIEATHPTYQYDTDICKEDWTNCLSSTENGYKFSPGTYKLYDDHVTTAFEAVRKSSWWKPNGMTVSVNGVISSEKDIHCIRVYRKIVDSNEWPQYLVLYMDGNLRLIPHPLEGALSVCYGSSVIIGPASVSERPIAEISSVNFNSASNSIEINYKSGGSATIFTQTIDRSIARIQVVMNYSTDIPFATIRSMFVEDGNSDVDYVQWTDNLNKIHDESIMTFQQGIGAEYFFYRKTQSKHNTSAPNIRIRLQQLLF